METLKTVKRMMRRSRRRKRLSWCSVYPWGQPENCTLLKGPYITLDFGFEQKSKESVTSSPFENLLLSSESDPPLHHTMCTYLYIYIYIYEYVCVYLSSSTWLAVENMDLQKI